MNRLEKYLEVSPRIREALDNNRPVVTLESTIISHGMPYPRNVETALKVEEVVRSCGAEPATVAVIGGKLKVGISEEEITHLGKKGLGVIKASRRDLPVLCARGEDGATTVAATMILSADLEELAETPVMVVCAGAKSILDLGLTLEYLETKGVTVLGYQTEELPAFYTRKSGFKVDYRMDTPEEIAAAFSAKEDLGLRGGMLVTNPIPEQYAMDHDYISRTIEDACAEAAQKGVKGKELTPFLLDRIQQITAGKSLEANIELVYNNARLASRIAVELCKK